MARVQTSPHYHGANVASVSGALSSAPVAGNAIVVMIGGFRGTDFDTGSVTDNRGNTYTLAKKASAQNGCRSAIYYALNVSALTPTITVNAAAGSDNYIEFCAVEFSNFVSSSVVDKDASATGATTTSPPSGTTAATTTTPQVLVAVLTADNTSVLAIQPQSGWTQEGVENDGTTNVNWSAATKIDSGAVGAKSHTWSGSNGPYSACIATFKEAAASGAPTPIQYTAAFGGQNLASLSGSFDTQPVVGNKVKVMAAGWRIITPFNTGSVTDNRAHSGHRDRSVRSS